MGNPPGYNENQNHIDDLVQPEVTPADDTEQETVTSSPEKTVKVKKFEKPKKREKRAKQTRELVDFGDYKAFVAERTLRIRGKEVSVPDYRVIVTEMLLDEMVKHGLITNNNRNNSQAIEKTLGPVLTKIFQSNPNFEPANLRVEGSGPDREIVCEVDKTRLTINFADVIGTFKVVDGGGNYVSTELTIRAGGPEAIRKSQQIRKINGQDSLDKIQEDFQSIPTRYLKVYQAVTAKGQDFVEAYLAAKRDLATEGQDDDGEEAEAGEKNNAAEIVEAFENILVHFAVPNYRDTLLYSAVLNRVQNYEQKEKQEKQDAISQILENPGKYRWGHVEQATRLLSLTEKARFYSDFVEAAGYIDNLRYVERTVMNQKRINSMPPEFRIKIRPVLRPRNFLEMAGQMSLRLLQQKESDPDFQDAPNTFYEQSTLETYNVLAERKGQKQPAVVLQEGTGKPYLKLFIPHPKPNPESRRIIYKRIHLPLGEGASELSQPQDAEDAKRYYDAAVQALGKRDSFNPTINLVEAYEPGKIPADPEFEITFGQITQKKRLSELVSGLNFSRQLTAAICAREFLEWRRREKTEGREALNKAGAWKDLPEDTKNKIGKMVTILSYGGIPSIAEQLFAENIRAQLPMRIAQSESARPDRFKVGVGARVEKVEAVEEAKPPIAGFEKIKLGQADYQLARDLVYTEFLNEGELLKTIQDKATEYDISPEALVLRSVAALDRLLAGQKRILYAAAGHLVERRKTAGASGKLTPEEALLTLVRSLRAVLSRVAVTGEQPASNEAMAFAESLAGKQSLDGKDYVPPGMLPFFHRAYDGFVTDANKTKFTAEKLQKQFLEFWVGWGRQQAEKIATSRQLGSGRKTNLLE